MTNPTQRERDEAFLAEVRRQDKAALEAIEREQRKRADEREVARREYVDRTNAINAAHVRLREARRSFRDVLLEREDVKAYIAWRVAEIRVYDAEDHAAAAGRAAGIAVGGPRPPSALEFAELARLICEEEVLRNR